MTVSVASAGRNSDAGIGTDTNRRSNSFVTVEGDGVGIRDDGSIWYDENSDSVIRISARSGWLINGQESVTVTPVLGGVRMLSATSRLSEDDKHIHFFPCTTNDFHVEDIEIGAKADEISMAAMYAVPDTSTVVSVSAKEKLLRKGRHMVIKSWGTCKCGKEPVPRSEVEYYDVEPDAYEWTAEGPSSTLEESTWSGEVTKGDGQKITFTVHGVRHACSECSKSSATAETKLDVYELSIERDDYLGLDMTDAMKGQYVKRDGKANIDPVPASSTYKWNNCGRCDFLGDVDKQDVVYGGTEKTGGSESFLAEPLSVFATAKNSEGKSASANCTTNFTVVKVDVVKDGWGEMMDEVVEVNGKLTPGVARFVKNKLGEYSQKALLSIKDHRVCIAIEPKGLCESDVVSVGFNDKELIENECKVADKEYPVGRIETVRFGLLGNKVAYKKPVTARHLKSKAKDEIDYCVYDCTFTIYANFSAYYNDDHEHKLTNDFGHAFWKFDVDDISLIPDDLREYVKVLMGFGPEGDDYFGGPGSVGDEGDNSYAIVQECLFNEKTITGFAYHKWHIKLDELISGLSYVKGLCEAKDLKYHLLSYNCTDVALAVGASAGVDVPCFAKGFVNTPAGLWNGLSDLNNIIGEEE